MESETLSIEKNPQLIPMQITTQKQNVFNMLISENTKGYTIMAHLHKKIGKQSNESQFVWVVSNGILTVLNKEVTAKELFEKYKSEDGKVHLTVQTQDTY